MTDEVVSYILETHRRQTCGASFTFHSEGRSHIIRNNSKLCSAHLAKITDSATALRMSRVVYRSPGRLNKRRMSELSLEHR